MVETDKKNGTRGEELGTALDEFIDNTGDLTENSISGDRFRASISTTGIEVNLNDTGNSTTVVNGEVISVDIALTPSSQQSIKAFLGDSTLISEDTETNFTPSRNLTNTDISGDQTLTTSSSLAYNSRTDSFMIVA